MDIDPRQGVVVLITNVRLYILRSLVKIIFWMFVLLNSNSVSAQHEIILHFKNTHDTPVGLKDVVMDSSQLHRVLQGYINELHRDNYWMASVDSVLIKNDTAFIELYRGDQWSTVKLTNIHVKDAADMSIPDRWINKRHITWDEINNLKQRIVHKLANQGYPFASAIVDAVRVMDGQLCVDLLVEKGKHVRFDSLAQHYAFVSSDFLARYIGANYNRPFSQKVINALNSKIKELPYLELNDDPLVDFRLGRAAIHLDLSKVNVNQFDGILGFIPDQNNESQLTGEVNLSLMNLFKSGKSLDFQWIKLKARSQLLDINYVHPLLLKSPLDVSFGFYQIKEDTLFSNRSLLFDIKYDINSRWKIGINYENFNGNSLIDNGNDSGDFDTNFYGFSTSFNTLNDQMNPSRGFKLIFSTSVGDKTTTTDANNFNEDTASSTQYRINASLGSYYTVNSGSIIYAGFNTGLLQNSQGLFLNDLSGQVDFNRFVDLMRMSFSLQSTLLLILNTGSF